MGARQAPASPPMGTSVFHVPPPWAVTWGHHPALAPAAPGGLAEGGMCGTAPPGCCWGVRGGGDALRMMWLLVQTFFFFSFCLRDIFIIKVKSPVLLLHVRVSLCSGWSPCPLCWVMRVGWGSAWEAELVCTAVQGREEEEDDGSRLRLGWRLWLRLSPGAEDGPAASLGAPSTGDELELGCTSWGAGGSPCQG